MKKIIYLSILLTGFYGFSQNREKGTIELAPIIGYSSANYYGDKIVNNNSTLNSFDFGINSDYYFNDNWSLRSGLLLQTMGSRYGQLEDKIKYLTIPVNANWHFGSTRKWNLNFGPSIGFLISAETNGEDVKEFVSTTQIGFNLGIGYKIEVTEKFGILFDIQGLSGLTEILKDSNVSIKNSYTVLNIGGVFKL